MDSFLKLVVKISRAGDDSDGLPVDVGTFSEKQLREMTIECLSKCLGLGFCYSDQENTCCHFQGHKTETVEIPFVSVLWLR